MESRGLNNARIPCRANCGPAGIISRGSLGSVLLSGSRQARAAASRPVSQPIRARLRVRPQW